MGQEQTAVKELVEALRGLELLALDYKAVMANGKVDAGDLSVLSSLFLQFSELKAAVDGADKIPAELKDLSEEEILQVAAAAFKIVKAIKG